MYKRHLKLRNQNIQVCIHVSQPKRPGVCSTIRRFSPTITSSHPKKPSHRRKTPFTTLKSGTNIILKKSWEFFVIKIVKHASGVFRLKPPGFTVLSQNKYLFLAIQPEDSKRLGAMISTALVYLWCRTCPGPKTVSPTFARFGGIQNVQRDTL